LACLEPDCLWVASQGVKVIRKLPVNVLELSEVLVKAGAIVLELVRCNNSRLSERKNERTVDSETEVERHKDARAAAHICNYGISEAFLYQRAQK
jgi:hypothetical protein